MGCGMPVKVISVRIGNRLATGVRGGRLEKRAHGRSMAIIREMTRTSGSHAIESVIALAITALPLRSEKIYSKTHG